MKVWLTAATDIGKERQNNEDCCGVCQDVLTVRWEGTDNYVPIPECGVIAVVADGMGGPNAGEVAAGIVIDKIKALLADRRMASGNPDETFPAVCNELIRLSQDAIREYVCQNPDAMGMGTTLVVLWLVNGLAHVAWCGDSRCYVFHPGKGLRPLTKDHSYVQELVDKGEISQEEAFLHPENNVITKGIGDLDVPSDLDYVNYPVESGDIFLLCSDGLCGSCRDDLIERIVATHQKDMKQCRQALIKAALDAGGYDNIAVALVAVTDVMPEGARFSLTRWLHRKTKK